MRVIEQAPFDLPHVRVSQPPVVRPHHAQVDHGIAGDAARQVDIRIHITRRKRPRGGEGRFASMKARIAGPRHRPPSSTALVDEDDVIERIDRLKAQDERRIAVLFERDSREQRGLEAVGAAVANDAAEAAQRRASPGLVVVGKPVEVPLEAPGRGPLMASPGSAWSRLCRGAAFGRER